MLLGMGGTLDVAPGSIALIPVVLVLGSSGWGVGSAEAGEEQRGLPVAVRDKAEARVWGERWEQSLLSAAGGTMAAQRALPSPDGAGELPVPGAASTSSSGGRSPSRAAGAEGPWADCWSRR